MLFCFFFAALLQHPHGAGAFAQNLSSEQHTVLMKFYDGCVPPLDATRYQRFSLDENCDPRELLCYDGAVILL